MCGIVGIVSERQMVAGGILEGLRRLEYRGYDSAGIATVDDGAIHCRRAEGKLARLQAALAMQPLSGRAGIGHTRWATHGAPNERNAHPHASDRVAVVHNGIIENFRDLRRELEAKGYVFTTETDTEVVTHLLTWLVREGMRPDEAVPAAIARLEGAFALGILFADDGAPIYAARRGSPLAIGYGAGEMYLGSDALALAPLTNRVTYLEDGDWVELTPHGARLHDEGGRAANREIRVVQVSSTLAEKGEHRHFMAKEIFEQPAVIGYTLSTYIDPTRERVVLPDLPFSLRDVPRAVSVACGTAHHAGSIGRYWLEQIGRLAVEVDVASEFRYRGAVLPPGGLALFTSQSGETADTLAALRHARACGQHVLSIVNVPESSIARESAGVLPTHAGPEIGVASTKAFTCQLSVFAALAVATGRERGVLDEAEERRLTHGLIEVPRLVAEALHCDEHVRAIAAELTKARDVLYLGRGPYFPLALEGALKLKEISYIHAEGYAAGEMKHGPIALIDEEVPVVVIAPSGAYFEKTISNMRETHARGGRVLLISDRRGIEEAGQYAWESIEVPEAEPLIAPILCAIPVQLLAYHTAVLKGTDVDQPRNLAKSVTVE
jgi:glucosamine--fructose-6-phosphate aminotransferase (isomerizing)